LTSHPHPLSGNLPSSNEIFVTLFNCWSYSPVATFSLCLYSQRYDLSAQLVACFATVEVTVNFLMQIDKLVQLLESPVFIPVRLHLLDVNSKHHRNLLKSLYGLLMMLPQSQAYKTLSDRLSTVSSLKMHLSLASSNIANEGQQQKRIVTVPSSEDSAAGASGDHMTPAHQLILSDLPPSSVSYGPLLQHFEEIQDRHSAFKTLIFQQQNKMSFRGSKENKGPAAAVAAAAVTASAAFGGGEGPGDLSARSMSPDGMGSELLMKSSSTTESV
jgi:hypothetical protein